MYSLAYIPNLDAGAVPWWVAPASSGIGANGTTPTVAPADTGEPAGVGMAPPLRSEGWEENAPDLRQQVLVHHVQPGAQRVVAHDASVRG